MFDFLEFARENNVLIHIKYDEPKNTYIITVDRGPYRDWIAIDSLKVKTDPEAVKSAMELMVKTINDIEQEFEFRRKMLIKKD